MSSEGMVEVSDLSGSLIESDVCEEGSVISAVYEGSRPVFFEIQALVTPANVGFARRTAVGINYNRINMILAVLEKKAGINLLNHDVYVNVVGGLRLDDTAADLTVALAVISSLKDIPVKEDAIALGELGLSGEIRSITNVSSRVNEAIRLGFRRIIIPHNNLKSLDKSKIPQEISVFGVKNIREAFDSAIG
jgi:DNA repair protein RadA/Sms